MAQQMGVTIKLIGFLILSVMLLASCGGGGGGGGDDGGATTSVTLSSIAITPLSSTVPVGLNNNYTATGTFSDASTADITSQVSWASSDTGVATIDSSTGVATGVATGSSTVTATLSGITSPGATLTVTAATLTSISITPTNPSTPKGVSVPFTATGTYSDSTTGNVSGSVTWTSSNTVVSTVNGSGIASSLAVGTTTITAMASGITSNNATLAVTAAELTAIGINPPASSVANGLTTNFTAGGVYTDGSVADITTQVTWASSNTGIATIGATTGVATGVAVGSSNITASLNGINATASTLTVNTATITAIDVTPVNSTIPLGTPVAFTAIATYSDGNTSNVSGSVAWSSGNAAIVTLNASGIATTLAQGNTTVTASASGVTSNSVTLSVIPKALTTITITPPTSSVAVGLNTNFTASGTYSDASTADLTTQVIWSSSNSVFADIFSTSGVAFGLSPGSTNITATLNGIKSNTAILAVNPAILTSISITPANPSTPLGVSVPFTATGTYTDRSTGNITGAVTWNTSNVAVATFAGSNIANTVASGSSNITATLSGVTSNTASLIVTPPVLNSIAISPPSASVAIGSTVNFTATGTYSNGTADITTQVSWVSSNTGVATVGSATGSAKGSAFGSTNISASLGGVSSNVAVMNVTLLMGGAIQNGPLALSRLVTTFAGRNATGNVDGIGTTARFNFPQSITTDGINLYVADTNNHNIRQIVISTGVVTTLAGSGSAGVTNGIGTAASFRSPVGITTDGINLYVTDTGNNQIRQIVIATGVVTQVAGSAIGFSGKRDGTGTAARFNRPRGITTDGASLYVTDTNNHTIRRIAISNRLVSTLAGSGTAGSTNGTGTAASFNFPDGIVTDSLDLYVADTMNHKIRKVGSVSGAVTTLAGSFLSGSADGTGSFARFNRPTGITTDGTNLYVADTYNHKIRKIQIASKAVSTLAGSGAAGSANGPGTIASFTIPKSITTDGTDLYIVDTNNHLIRKIQ